MDKKYQIITFGCQMNKSDSEKIKAVFEQLNCTEVKNRNEADCIVINACSVRQTAIQRIWGLVNEYEKIKKNNKLVTILTGCVLESDRKKFLKRFDFVFDIKNLSQLEVFLNNKSQFVKKDYFEISPSYSKNYTAFVPIMTGCSNYCSYCAVPYVRGKEQSRSVKSVLAEVSKLVDNGCKEIIFLGQNVNSYQPNDICQFNQINPYKHNFARLLWETNLFQELDRISFFSAHPKDMSDEVIDALALPKMMNYIHLALQSGDDDILQAMNRKYSVRDYFEIIKKIRSIKPQIAIGTDIIVGFPGESRIQFENSLKFYRKTKFDIVYHSQFSPRIGTACS